MEFGLQRIANIVDIAVAFVNLYSGSKINAHTLSEASGHCIAETEVALRVLRKSGVVASVRGKFGGYHLVSPDATVADVVKNTPIKPLRHAQSAALLIGLNHVRLADLSRGKCTGPAR